MERYSPLFAVKVESGMEWKWNGMEWNGTPFCRPMVPMGTGTIWVLIYDHMGTGTIWVPCSSMGTGTRWVSRITTVL